MDVNNVHHLHLLMVGLHLVLLNNNKSLSFFQKLGYVPDEKAMERGEDPVALVCEGQQFSESRDPASERLSDTPRVRGLVCPRI